MRKISRDEPRSALHDPESEASDHVLVWGVPKP